MKKTAYIFVLMLTFSACTKDLTSLNVDPKNPASVPSYSLFTQAERSMANTLTSSSVNLNIFRLIEQQWTETTYLNETRYQLPSRNQPDAIWSALYTGALANFQQAKTKLVTDVPDAGTQKNETAIIDILQAYTYFYLVTTFGNVPYSQALDINNPFPKYDDAKTIYNDLLARLDKDIAALDPSAGSFGDADVIYKGDPAAWKKFANTLKLKMALIIADTDNTKAQSTVLSAIAGGVFTSNADNATFKYVSSPPNTNPIWVDLVQSQRHDFVATTEFMNYLKPNTVNQDPRTPFYFALSSNGVYAGAPNGSGNGGLVYSQYSLPSGPLLTPGSTGSLTNPDFPGLLLDYAETQFNLAEAVVRGYIGGSAATYYNNGVTASITYWGGTTTQATAYLLQPDVAYLTASGTALQKIARQEYVALYNRGWDAWTLTRRLDFPVLIKPTKAYTDFPVRFTYPVSEQNVNVTNYTQASSAIGGDDVTTKLFFDKN
jgi:hypothetical protein